MVGGFHLCPNTCAPLVRSGNNALITLRTELTRQFPNSKILLAFGIYYPSYWVSATSEHTFSHDLNALRKLCGKPKKFGPPNNEKWSVLVLDTRKLDARVSCFKPTMTSNVEWALEQPILENPLSNLCEKNEHEPCHCWSLLSVSKSGEHCSRHVLSKVEDDKIFSTFNFLKSKLCNYRLTTHLHLCEYFCP
jgi:hypothetical protein